MAALAALGGKRAQGPWSVQELDRDAFRRGWGLAESIQHAGHAGAVDAAEEAMSFQVPGEVTGLRHWADDPVASGALMQMRSKDLANAAGHVYRRETRESDGVAGVGVAGEHAKNVTVVVKFDPGQPAKETKPFGSVNFDSRGKLFLGRQWSCAGGLFHSGNLKNGTR